MGLVPTPTSVNGEPPDDETVVLGEGAILAQGVGTMRTMKQEPELEATAIATFQNKPIFPPASLADVYGEGGEEGVAECRITDARPLYVWDYYQKNKEKHNETVKKYHEANREKIYQQLKEKRNENKIKIVVSKLESIDTEVLAKILIQARKTSLLDFEN